MTLSDIPKSDVVVIGAGVIGMACACLAAQAGAKVTVIEAGEHPGQGASGAKAGLLTTVAEGTEGSPYSRFSTLGLERLLDRLPNLEKACDHSAQLELSPHLRLSSSAAETDMLQAFINSATLAQSRERLQDAAEIATTRPWLSRRVTAGVIGGVAHHINPSAFLAVLATQLKACGGKILTGTPVAKLIKSANRVTGVHLRDGHEVHAEAVVIAAGFHSLELLKDTPAAHLLPDMRAVRGQMITLDSSSVGGLPKEVISTGRGYIVPKQDGRIIVGATHEEGMTKRVATLSGLAMLTKIAAVAPVLTSLPVIDTFVGIRPQSADGLPIIGPVPGLRGVCLATGHGSHGILLSLATAESVLAILTSKPVSEDVASFDPQRMLTTPARATEKAFS